MNIVRLAGRGGEELNTNGGTNWMGARGDRVDRPR
jgi:hypothetical protein